MEGASTHIICNGEEIVRTKIRDTLLRCLQKLWTEHFHTSCNLSFFHISALWINPGFPSVSVHTLQWNNIFFLKWTKCFLYAEGIHVHVLSLCSVVKLSADDYFEITCVVIHVCYNFQLNNYQKRGDKMIIDCFSLLDFFLFLYFFFGGGYFFVCFFYRNTKFRFQQKYWKD